MTDPTEILTSLQATHPGVVEEWERQKTESPDWNFPDYHTPQGLAWWLRSEAVMTLYFGDPLERDPADVAIGKFCVGALRKLRE